MVNDSGPGRSRSARPSAVQREVRQRLAQGGAGFLLSQLGFHASKLWRQQLEPFGIGAREANLLLRVAADEGPSQRALAEMLGVSTSLVVGVVDALAKEHLIERRPRPDDRRIHALYLTEKGWRVAADLTKASTAHERDLCAGLRPPEQKQLVELLQRLAARHGLIPHVHPGFADSHGKTWGRART
jgi:DNA-binding MarR family transcriptional regulator